MVGIFSTENTYVYKVLILEDVPADAVIIQEELGKSDVSATYRVADNRQAFEETLENWLPDLILADYTLLDFNGLDALKYTRQRNPYIPFIFVTGTLSTEKAVDTLHHGATDFILKDNLSTLSTAVVRALREFSHLQAVEESEKRFRAMADSAPVMLWVSDEDNKPTFFNRTMHHFTGMYNTAELSDALLGLVHEHDRQEMLRDMEEGFSHKGEFTMEYRLRNHEGEYCWFYTKAVPRPNPTGDFAGYIYSGIDYTEQKRLDEERDAFLGIASHELKTPLTTLKAYNQLLIKLLTDENESFSKEQALIFLSESAKSIDRMSRLVSSLLDVSRIQLNQEEYHFEKVDLNELILHLATTFDVRSPKHAIQYNEHKGAYVKGDSDKLEQVFANLIENAVKYSPDGGKVIIACKNGESDAVISIKDNGIGMSDRDMNRIFGRFFRSEKDSSKYPGLGIGLYLVSQIVKAHQGRVWVNSEPGSGAEFFVSLPLLLENGKNIND